MGCEAKGLIERNEILDFTARLKEGKFKVLLYRQAGWRA